MKFSSYALKNELINALYDLGYIDATKVQDLVIPKALRGESLIVQSETGSGKTHSFIIPILNNLVFNHKLQAIIISPTRELAKQTYTFFNSFKKYFNKLNVKEFLSGVDTTKNETSLLNGCEVIISTPGRLKYLLENTKIDYSFLKTIVLDEADMLFDKSFVNQIDDIIKRVRKKLQIEVFSATISKEIQNFAKKYISPNYVLLINKESFTSNNVTHYFINTKHHDINNLILKFIKIEHPYFLIIFANTIEEVESIYNFLSKEGLNPGILTGNLRTRERNSMIRRIQNNEFSIVVCTDIASRGLDINNASDVLNIDLPNNIEYYFHRAGRIGRYKNKGNSFVFYNNESYEKIKLLLSYKIEAHFLKFDLENNKLVIDKFNKKKKKKKIDTELDKEIKKAISQTKTTKVKPGYKKKVRNAVDKVKRKHRRQMIKKDIRRQMVERYKENARKSKQ